VSTEAKNIKVFISYKKLEGPNPNVAITPQIALDIASSLEAHDYAVFIDKRKIEPGRDWTKQIHENVVTSDVLIVLLEPKTAESDWVQREVDMARGAHVSILPLQIDDSVDIKATLERLALYTIHRSIKFSGTDEDYQQLFADVERLSKLTRDEQAIWINKLGEQRRVRPADVNANYAAYKLQSHPDAPTIHIATGDMTQMSGIDVMVNSENDYMQMARIYESNTLSSVMRRKGSQIEEGRVIKDCIQEELDRYIKTLKTKRPIMRGQVIPTTTGYEKGELADTGARYILHAATVTVDPNDRKIQPIRSDAGIIEAVINCFKEISEIEQNEGIVLPNGTRLSRAPHRPIESIIFPLFGTGQGGRSTSEVAPPMTKAFKQFLRRGKYGQLKRIHFCVFSITDVQFVHQALDAEGFEQIQED
jgi:O-acetyl-ADP-ribose deacetylase (regulator of RNase III)